MKEIYEKQIAELSKKEEALLAEISELENKIGEAKENIKDIPQIKPVDPYPPLVLYADKDGLWYFYTIWHLEQLTKI